jgi:hypothetical protein
MGIQLKNNASGTLATAISASDTGIVLTTGNGASFPALGVGDYFYATLESTGGTFEVVRATARSGDSLTVVRAQEGSTANSFAAGARFELRVTAQSVADIAQLYATDADISLRNDLAASTGSLLVGFLPPGTGAASTTVGSKLAQSVSFDDFIPANVNPSTTDVQQYIQTAIVYGFANGLDVVGTAGRKYTIGSTLLIPQNSPAPTFVRAQKYNIDGRNCIFRMIADTPLFESAYDNGGVLTSNYGTALDAYYSIGITLTNFGVESAVGQLSQPTLKIQDWHQQCQITNITSGVSAQMMWANNCYYTTFDNMQAGTLGPSRVGDRFIWFGATNLCKISRLVAVNSVTGYRFDGPVTATVMESMSFEGQTVGVAFNSAVYDIAIRDSYFEGFYDVAIAFNDYVEGAIIDNNYVNFLNLATSFFLYYNPLPGTNVVVTPSNQLIAMPSDANIIKVREDVYGEGIVIQRRPIAVASVTGFNVNNAIIGRRIDWQQKATKPNVIANVNNDFIPGNYSSRFTDGFNNSNGFDWVNLSSTSLRLRTRIAQNFVQLVYVNIEVSFSGGGPTYIAGLFIGNQFYKATGASFAPSGDLTGATDANGYFRVDGGFFFAGNLTGVRGEIRLI